MLQHHFGPGLLIYIYDVFESDPPAQTDRWDTLRAIALMFRLIIAVLQNLNPAPRSVAIVVHCAASSAALRVTGRNDTGVFHHQNDCSIRSPRAMLDAFGNDKSLLWLQINRATFEIDDKVPLQDKEELVVIVMFVPVVFALHDPKANNGVIHLAECLVIPLIGAGLHQSRNVHQAECWKLDIDVSSVRIILLFAHGLEND